MLLDGLVAGLLGIVFGAVKLLGTFIPSGSLGTIAGGVWVGYAWLNTFLPMAEILGGMGFLVGVYLWMFGYKMFRSVWSLIPIVGGHG